MAPEAPITNEAKAINAEHQAVEVNNAEMQEQGQVELREEFKNISIKLIDIWYKYCDLRGDGSIESVRPVDNEVYAELYSKIEALSSELQIKMDGNVRLDIQPDASRKAVGSVEGILMLNLSNMLKRIKERLSGVKTYKDYYTDSVLREDVARLHGIAEFWTEVW